MKQRPGVLIVAFAALLRLSYLRETRGVPPLADGWLLDSKHYLAAAEHGVEGVFDASPFYVLYLSLMSVDAVLVSQVLMGVGTVAMVYALAQRLAGGLAAAGSALLYALYPAAALFETKVLPAAIATFASTAALTVLVIGSVSKNDRRRPLLAILAGALFGIAALCHPTVLPFVAVAAGFWVWRVSGSGPWRAAVVLQGVGLMLAAGVCILPATLHNYRASGALVPISNQGGITFYQGNNPRAEGGFSLPEGFTGSKETQAREAAVRAEALAGRSLDVGEVDAFWRQQGIDFLRRHPEEAGILLLRKLRYWLGSAELSSEYTLEAERRFSSLIKFFFVPFGLILSLSAVALFAGRLRRTVSGAADLWLLATFVLLNLLATGVFFFASRYRLVAVPSLAVLASLGIRELFEIVRSRSYRRVGLVAVATCSLAYSLSIGERAVELQAGIQLYNWGNEAFSKREYDRAAALYEAALESRHATPDIYFNLGQAKAQAGDYAAARGAFQRVLQLNPKDREAKRLLEVYGHAR